MRRAARKDTNESSIVGALRKCHYQVIVPNAGDSFTDLIIGAKGVWILAEVKRIEKAIERGQLLFLATSTGPVGVVTNEDEALNLANDPERYALSQKQKDVIALWLKWNGQETLSVRKFLQLVGEG